MNQDQFDVAEFCILNKAEINQHINEQVAPMLFCERLFDSNPHLWTKIITNHKVGHLRSFLTKHFPNTYEHWTTLIDPEFYNKYLE